MKKVALILAGGKGTRLWPLSRENYPKQFVEFKDSLSLFQMTLKRVMNVFAAENIYIISQENYRFSVLNQIDFLPQVPIGRKNLLKKNIVFEPLSRSTLPAILLSIRYIEEIAGLRDNDSMYVFPSDQFIKPDSVFKKCIKKSEPLVVNGKIAVFGVKPAFPKKGYGYIIAKKRFKTGYLADKFIEKPPEKEATTLMSKGAFWNAGIFCFNKKTFLEELQKFQPELHKYYTQGYEGLLRHFPKIKAVSMDYGIMQKTGRAAMVKFNLKWSDLGDWDSFQQFFAGGRNNFNIGKAEFLKSRGCFTYSGTRLMCLVGIDDVIAIDSPDSLLLVKKGRAGDIKELTERMNKKGYLHSKDGYVVHRPWGYYTVIHERADYKVKEIGIYPKKSLSLQKHKYRSEHWNIVDGRVCVSLGTKKVQAGRNESVFVSPGIRHSVYNPTRKIAKIIEVQIGSYVGEDDIVRYTEY